MIHTVYGDIDKTLLVVQKQYQIAMQYLIQVGQGMNPPISIQLNQSDLVGSTYLKIIKPYVMEIQGYSGVVISAYVRKIPYVDDLKLLSQNFDLYEKKVIAVANMLPKDLQNEALMLFYGQLTDSLVQNCAKIVQDLSYAMNLTQDNLDAALIAYNLAWKAQTPTMKLNGFADIAAFKTNMMTWMINLYQGAITKATTELQTTKDRKKVYAQLVSYYDAIATVFTNSGESDKANVAKQQGLAMQKQEDQFDQAADMIKKAEQQANEARISISIDYVNPVDTKNSLSVSLKGLQAAQGLYQSALTIYTNQQDEASANLCQVKINELSGDQHVRGIQLLWVLFLQDAYRTGVPSKIKSCSTLKAFYKLDPIKSTISIETVVSALSDLLALCSVAPNNFNTSLAIMPLLQQALTLYQSATSGHPQDTSSDRLASVASLNDLQDGLNHFTAMLQGMIGVSQGGVANSNNANQIAQLVVDAKAIDLLFAKNSLLKNLFFYFPSLEFDSVGKQSFVSFVIQYFYRIFMTNVYKQKDTADISVLSHLIVLQDYKEYMSGEQFKSLEGEIVNLAKKINVEQEAKAISQKAQESSDWKNHSKQSNDYQSGADSLWNRAIQFYEIAIQLSSLPDAAAIGLSSTAVLEQAYAKILQNYIGLFIKNAPVSLGYQLHLLVPLYKLNAVGTKLQDKTINTFVETSLGQLFSDKSGFFAQVEKIISTLKLSTTTAKEKTSDENIISQLISQINVIVQQQSLAVSSMTELLGLSKDIDPLLVSVSDSATITLTMTLGQDHYTLQIINPIVAKIHKLTSQVADAMLAAEGAENKQDFFTAQQQYQNVQQYCLAMLQLTKNSADVQKYKDQYFLAKTRFTGASLASQVVTQGSGTLGSIKNIPQNYYAASYKLENVSMALLGGTIPASLQTMKTLTVVKDTAAKSDALAIFKAYLIYQLLQQQGLNFIDCYSDYKLQKKSTISKKNQSILAGVEASVNDYIKQCKDVVFSAMVAQNAINFVIEQMPISPIIPLYATGPYAAVYFVGASALFQPGKALIQVGGVEYVPGQDQVAYQRMLEQVAYAYLSQAQQQLMNAQSLGQALVASMTQQIKAKKIVDESMFLQNYNQIKQAFIGAQSLLFATGGSAYYYFDQADKSDLAKETKEIFLGSYKTQIDLFMQLLIGDPTSNLYNTVLSDINQAYISWSVELDPVKDANLITQNHQAVVGLFQKAGDDCMAATFEDKMFPGVQQHYYLQAGSNYQAANKQYQSMKDSAQAAAMNDKVLQAFLLEANQKVGVYYFAKQNGFMYTPANMQGYDETVSTKPEKITFNDLCKAYQAFQSGSDINPGKTAAYNTMQNLLLDSAMYYQFLANSYSKLAPSAKTPAKSSDTTTSQMDAALLTYLQTKKIIPADKKAIPYIQETVLPQLFGLSNDLYVQFAKNYSALSDWSNALYIAIQYQYIDDYEGGVNTKLSTSGQQSDFSTKWQSFFTALQKESSSLQNPASSYIG